MNKKIEQAEKNEQKILVVNRDSLHLPQTQNKTTKKEKKERETNVVKQEQMNATQTMLSYWYFIETFIINGKYNLHC